MKHREKAALALAALAATAGLAACGSSDESSTDAVSGPFELVAGAPAGYDSLAGEATLERADGATEASVRLTGLEPDGEYVAHLHTEGCDAADPGGPHFQFEPGGGEEPPNEIHLEFSADAAGSGRAKASADREVPLGEAGSIVLHEAEDHHMTSSSAEPAEAVFVHEGHHHGDAGEGQGEIGSGHGEGPAKIACAELEGGSAETASPVATVVVRDGEPVGGIQQLEYSAGEEVRFEVESDVADEVHVHGYDLMEDVPAGGTVSFDFPAQIEGIFEVELEGRKQQIAELRVNP